MRVPTLFLALIALTGAPAAGADTLEMPEGAAERPAVAMELPGKGMSMKQVRARFGEPQETRAPVGEPPITRWVYDGYTVYFEHQYVIHSVLHPQQ